MLYFRLLVPCTWVALCACSSSEGSGTESPPAEMTTESSDLAPGEDASSEGGASDPAMAMAAEAGDSSTPAEGNLPVQGVQAGTRSAGCGNADPPVGAGSLMIQGAQAEYVINLPPDYDPNTPMPLVFGFHGRNRTHVELQTVDARQIRSELEPLAVVAYLKSQGGPGWNSPQEIEPSVEFFEAMYDQMLESYCIDTSRVFAIGHSSGGFFANILGCRFGDRLRAVGAIAGALEAEVQPGNCQGQVAALMIHGVRDSVVSFSSGEAERDYYVEVNGCSPESTPTGLDQCVDYAGCADGLPVQWCAHEDPYYEDTNHGWPLFASQAAAEFFLGLPPE